MRVIDQLVYKITGDNTDLNKSLKESNTQTDGFRSKMSRLATFLTTGAIAIAAVSIAKKIVNIGISLGDAASDAQETQNKFNVTFSGIRDEADLTAENLSKNFGLSQLASQRLLSDTGDLLTGFGFTQESALDLSNQVNELAVDLASFTNYSGGAEGASAALTKALLGERESIKSLGIAITEADIKQLAEDKGIKGELDRQTKAMLTLELAIKQSKNAIGDFSRSQDQYANQKRIFEGNLEDLSAKLGERFLPAMTHVVTKSNEFLDFLINGRQPAKDLERAIDDLKGVSDEYDEIVKKLVDSEGTLTDTERNLLTARKELLAFDIRNRLLEAASAYDTTADSIDRLKKKQGEYNQEIEDNNDIIKNADALLETSLITQTRREQLTIARRQAQEDLAIANSNLLATELDLARQEGNLNEVIAKSAELYNDGLLPSIESIKNISPELYDAIVSLADGMKQAGEDSEALAGAAEETGDNLEDIDTSTKKVTASSKNLKLSQDGILGQFNVLGTVLPPLTQDQIDMANGYDAVAEAMEKTREYLNNLTEAQTIYSLANRDDAVVFHANATQHMTDVEKITKMYLDAYSNATVYKEKVDDLAVSFEDLAENGVKVMARGFEDVGKALADGDDMWGAFATAGTLAIASVLEALGAQLAAIAATKFLLFDFIGGGIALAESAAAYTAAGFLKAGASPKPADPADMRPEERTSAEPSEDIDVTPATSSSSSGTVGDLYIDGVIAGKIILKNLNGGKLGTVDKRIVK